MRHCAQANFQFSAHGNRSSQPRPWWSHVVSNPVPQVHKFRSSAFHTPLSAHIQIIYAKTTARHRTKSTRTTLAGHLPLAQISLYTYLKSDLAERSLYSVPNASVRTVLINTIYWSTEKRSQLHLIDCGAQFARVALCFLCPAAFADRAWHVKRSRRNNIKWTIHTNCSICARK